MVFGNLTLLQVQALVVSALAAALSFVLGVIAGPGTSEAETPPQKLFRVLQRRVPRPGKPGKNRGPTGVQEFVFVLVTAQIAASVSGLVLGAFMASLIIVCRRFAVDPDNIATPVAACLGDLLTLVLLALIGTALLRALQTFAPFILVVLLIGVLIGSVILARRNTYVRPLLSSGWGPLIAAMVISSGAGMLLDHYVERYEGFGILAIVAGGMCPQLNTPCLSTKATQVYRGLSVPFSSPACRRRCTRTVSPEQRLDRIPLRLRAHASYSSHSSASRCPSQSPSSRSSSLPVGRSCRLCSSR